MTAQTALISQPSATTAPQTSSGSNSPHDTPKPSHGRREAKR